MSLGPKNKAKDLEITMSNVKIRCGSELKLLGLIIDQNLDFSKHVSELCKRTARKVGVLTRLRNILPIKAKLIIYKSMVLPQLTYCHTVWNFCRSSDSRKLERIQERALKAIYNRKSGTYDEFLEMAKLPTLKNRRLQDIAILMYKVKNGLCPLYIKEIFQNNNNCNYNLRNSLDFSIPRFNTVTYGKHSLRYLGPVLWAKLDKKVKNAETLRTFKIIIRKVDLVRLMEDNCKNCVLCSG